MKRAQIVSLSVQFPAVKVCESILNILILKLIYLIYMFFVALVHGGAAAAVVLDFRLILDVFMQHIFDLETSTCNASLVCRNVQYQHVFLAILFVYGPVDVSLLCFLVNMCRSCSLKYINSSVKDRICR